MNTPDNIPNILELHKMSIQVTLDNLKAIPKSDIPNRIGLYEEALIQLKQQIDELSELFEEFGVK